MLDPNLQDPPRPLRGRTIYVGYRRIAVSYDPGPQDRRRPSTLRRMLRFSPDAMTASSHTLQVATLLGPGAPTVG